MSDTFELHEFFVEGRRKGISHVLLHISEPAIGEKTKGSFFGLCEIRNGTIEQIEYLQQMIDDIETGYYKLDQKGETHPFETILEQVNKRGHHILGDSRTKVDCFLGVIQEHTLIFAIHGQPLAHILYKRKDGWKDIDLIDQQEEHPTNKTKQLFSTITEGNLAVNDHFFITTPGIKEHFSFDRLKKIISSRSTEASALHIEKILQRLNSDDSFGGILFHRPEKKQVLNINKKQKTKKVGSAQSLQSLADKQRKTAETLSPPLGTKTKQVVAAVFSKEKKQYPPGTSMEHNYRPRPKKPKQQDESLTNTILITAGKALVAGIIGLFVIIKKTATLLVHLFTMIFILATNYGKQRQQVLNEISHSIHAKQRYIKELPLLSKILFLATILCAIIFMISVSTIRVQETKKQQATAYTEMVQSIRDKKDAADASIIYGDTEKALILLQEGETLIAQLDTNSEEKQTLALELTSDIQAILKTLQKITIVSPTLIGDLATEHPEAQTTHIEKIDDTLLIYGTDDSSHYKINLVSKQITAKQHDAIPNLRAANTPKEKDKIIFLAGDNNIAEFDPETNGISQKDITHSNSATVLSDIVVYNRKLYALAPSENQIYKYSQIQTGYDKGSSWVTSPGVNIESAVSLAIDGDIFVLTSDGKIVKFASGKKQDFGISGLDPKLDTPTKIWTYNDVDSLFILEPTNKRVVQLNKDGEFEAQFTAEEWSNPTDMIVDNEHDLIYIIDSQKIYSFSLL
jgi:hypothetical protein